jgi:hypothetical protein
MRTLRDELDGGALRGLLSRPRGTTLLLETLGDCVSESSVSTPREPL